jgi:putative addiction module CopG family antidote
MGHELPPNLERMVRERIAAGQYVSEDDVLLDAMLALEDVEERHEQLRVEIQRRARDAGTLLSQPLDRAAFKAAVRNTLDNRK